MSNKYNGWTNYETWNWNLWITNDQGEYETWINEAIAWVKDEKDHGQQIAVVSLAEQMEAAALTDLEDANLYGAFNDILSASLKDINWREFAQSFIDAVAERETHK